MANLGWFWTRNRSSQWFWTRSVSSAWFNRKDFGPSTSAAVTGTATASITEADVVAGGKTIIITLTGDTWIAAGAGSFDLQRSNILQGLDSAQAEALGWNLNVRDTEVVTAVVRTSDTIVTITLTAHAIYNITAQETITATVPAAVLTLAGSVVASPTFTVAVSAVSYNYVNLERRTRGVMRGVCVGAGAY